MFTKLTNKICKTTLCIAGVKLNAQWVFFSHKFTRRDICDTDQLRHRWRFAQNDARHRLSVASVYLLLHLYSNFCSQLGSNLCCWVAKDLVKRTQVSRFRRLIVLHAWWAETLPKEISRMTGCIAFESEAPHSSMRHWSSLWHAESRVCLQQTFWCSPSISIAASA